MQLTAANNNAWAIAWNETVNDSFGSHDQVEFAVFVSGTGVIFRNTFNIQNNNDAQDVRVATYSDPNIPGKDYAVLYYGDSSTTNLIEYSATTTAGVTQISPVAVVADPTTVAAGSVSALGDGRIEVGYDNILDPNQTSQDNFKIFDLRTTGVNIDDHTLNDGHAKDVAGTQFNDTFTGENNVNNAYYFIGSQTTGASPSDIFNGGTGTSWNTAIFADDRANYTVTPGVSTVIANSDPLHAHAGTLTVDQNVQALAFNPIHDPTPQPDGSLEASGDTLLLLKQFSHVVTLDSNTTLELSQPSTFTGHVADFAPGNVIDLDGFDLNSAVIAYSSGTLTVTDNTHVGASAAHIALFGSYNTATFNKTSDGHGGVDIGMTNADQAVSDNIIASASLLQGAPGSATIPTSLLLANDTDSNSLQLSIAAVAPADPPQQTSGSVQLQSGNVVYTAPAGFTPPAPGQQANDSFNYTLVDTNGAQSTGHVNLTVVGGSKIVGTPGNDIFISSSANESFTGVGGNDTFVFKPAFGLDTINDFHPGQDTIDLDHTLFADFAAVQSHLTTAGANTVITFDANDTITLVNVAPANLHATDFHFI